jgi:hypothetical protein
VAATALNITDFDPNDSLLRLNGWEGHRNKFRRMSVRIHRAFLDAMPVLFPPYRGTAIRPFQRIAISTIIDPPMAPQIHTRSLHPANRHGMVRRHVGIIGAWHRLVTASTAGVSVGRTGIRADYEEYRGGNLQVRSPGQFSRRIVPNHIRRFQQGVDSHEADVIPSIAIFDL